MKYKCACGAVTPCIECAGFVCEGCGADVAQVVQHAGNEPVVCQLNPWGYDPIENDNDGDEVWDD